VVWLAALTLILLPAATLAALSIGSTGFTTLFSGDPAQRGMILGVRLPRVAAAGIVGAALSVAGAALQAILRNPLAEPFVLGVSGGAALGGTAAILLGLTLSDGAPWIVILSALAALLSTMLLSAMNRVRGGMPAITILLTGVVFNAFASAIITFVKFLVPAQRTSQLSFWLSGMLGYETPSTLFIVGGFVLAGTVALAILAGRMNILSLGDHVASTLGVPPSRIRLHVFIWSSLLTGAAVSISGLVGFVGLIVPQGLRLAVTPDNRFLVPASAVTGAAFVMISDAFCRWLTGVVGSEPPLGAITALVGGPLFIWLLRKNIRGEQ